MGAVQRGPRQVEVYKRADERWAWVALAWNGEKLANDAGQGFENRVDCISSVSATIVAGVPILVRDGEDPGFLRLTGGE